jgi:hypothetical protein
MADHFAAFRKKSDPFRVGNQGNLGNQARKPLRSNGFGGSPNPQFGSPSLPTWGTNVSADIRAFPRHENSPDFPDVDAVLEREALALEGGVPATFARAFAVLQLARPAGVSRDRWEQAINDAGLFLDAWGHEAERLGWSAPDVVGPGYRALASVLDGARVSNLTATTAIFSDGRTFSRRQGGTHG